MAEPLEAKTELSDETLCAMAAEGDSCAEEELIIRYRRVVLSRSRSYYLMGGDNEDLVQEGMIGLLKAIRLYDPGRGASFRTYANLCVNHALISAVTSAARNKHLPLNSSISFENPLLDENSGYLSGQESDQNLNPEDLLITQEEIQERLDSIQTRLSDFERCILGYYLKGLTYSEISRQAGRPIKSVDNAVQRVRKKLSRHNSHSDFSSS